MTLTKLKELAEAATPGPWEYDLGNWQVEKCIDRYTVCETNYDCEFRSRFKKAHEDGEYIAAANPKTLLSLLDYIEALEEECELARSMFGIGGLNDRAVLAYDKAQAKRMELKKKLEEV